MSVYSWFSFAVVIERGNQEQVDIFIIMQELWKPILGYESLYEISNLGRVKSYKCKIGKIIKGNIIDTYTRFSFSKKIKKAHRLVAIHFIPNPNNYPLVCHKDETLDENGALYNGEDNLFWGTYKDNAIDRDIKGRANNHFLYNNPNKGKFGNDSKYSKPVNQYNLDGVFIKNWGGLREIERETLIHRGGISKCCNGLIKNYRGFIWKY